MGINAELQQINHHDKRTLTVIQLISPVVYDLIWWLNSVLCRDSDSVKMYAFYSLLVYIFYTVFKKEEEDALEAVCGASSDVCLATY